MLSTSTYGLVLLSLASCILAKTDLGGCTSTQAANSIVWYVPGTGEICSIPDCGGGRAPPKTDVPGCAGYAGTAPYVPSFWPGFAASATAPAAALTTSGLLIAPSSTLVTSPSPSPALVDVTTTLQSGAAPSSSITGLLFDTSAASRDITATVPLPSSASRSASAGAATVTGNAAARNVRGGYVAGAIVGAAAGLALI